MKQLWRKVNLYRYMMQLFDWLGPRGSLLLLCGIIWLQTGIGTLQGYSGAPDDAPHLLVPAAIRGVAWILAALVAIALAPTRSIKWHKVAISTLSVMPVIRLCSYLLSWVVSWSVFQGIFPHFPLDGAAKAEYLSTFWQSEVLLVVALMLAPATWGMITKYLREEETGDYDRTTKSTSEETITVHQTNQETDGDYHL